MKLKKIKKISFLIDHPFDLILFLGLKNLLISKNIQFESIALITDHRYFRKCDECESYFNEFDKVIQVARPSFSKNIFKQLLNTVKFIKTINTINQTGEVIYFSANRSEMTTQLLNKYKQGSLFRILQKNHSSIKEKDLILNYTIDLKRTILRNFYELIFSLPLSKMYVNKNVQHRKYIAYKNENKRNDLYLINNNFLPQSNEINFPYYFIYKNKISENKKVYFFGNRFLAWSFLDDNIAIDKINKVLRKIEKSYPEGTEFIYKPHPSETVESKRLELNKFKVLKESNSAELNYIKYKDQILAVYSIGSTSSKTAFNFGINSYVTYKLFNLDKIMQNAFDRLFDGMPKEMFIKNIGDIGKSKVDIKDKRFLNIENLLGKIINDE